MYQLDYAQFTFIDFGDNGHFNDRSVYQIVYGAY